MTCRAALALVSVIGCFAAGVYAGEPVPLEILEPAERTETVQNFPVSVGLIFPDGELPSAPGGAVVDDLGNAIPFDWDVTAWWSPQSNSVKWLQLHFKASSDRTYLFVPGASPEIPQGDLLAVEDGAAIELDTGPLQARLAPGNAPVFEYVTLNGGSILATNASFFEMTDDEGRALSCEDWTLTLEENTPLRAVVKAEGILRVPGEPALAKLSVRYQFFAGESFVRLYHTFIWMPKSLDPGANRISLRLRPAVGEQGVVRVGLSDYTDDAGESTFATNVDLIAYQDDVGHYAIREGGSEVASGARLGGWIAVEGNDGRGVSVSLKNAWQTYPTALAVRNGDLEIGLWPEEEGRFSFEERDIMPDDLYFAAYWGQQVAWTLEGGPTWFNTKDLLAERVGDFFAALQAQAAAPGDSPGKRIVSFLRSELQDRLADYQIGTPVPDGFRARIAHGMNEFLDDSAFYDAASWSTVDLKPKAQELLLKGIPNLDDGELVWLNRLLIESAFPADISPSDVPHFIHEASQLVNNLGYVAGGQGGARTHEITVLFYDESSVRTPSQINSLTQHPFVMRQAPESALRAPILGFTFAPVNTQACPEIERALDLYGRASFSRYTNSYDYGFLRFGMQRMNYPREGLYRWMAGMQYDQQLIPWLLFLRGGDRRFYEEAMNTAAYAMDMHVNHYNTAGVPPGYMSFVAGMPLPQGPTFWAYNMKIHFLSLCRHLTGYRRAGDVMDMAIEGVKQRYLALSPEPRSRQLYSMNMFFVQAYEETFDPVIKDLARASMDRTLDTHYDPAANLFAGNTQYLYRGLLSLYRLFPEPGFRDLMLDHLAGAGIPGLEWAGPTDNRSAILLIACAWAYEQTGDERYARILWDVTRTLADIAPDHDWDSPVPVEYPLGHFANYCHRVLPMLVGLGVMERHGLDFPEASSLQDLFVAVNQAGSTRTAFVRALKDGALNLRLKGREGGEDSELSVAAFRPATGEKVAETVVPRLSEAVLTNLPISTVKVTFEGALTIPNAKTGEVYRLSFQGGDLTAGLMVLSDDAQVVHQLAPDSIKFYGHSYQYYLGSRVFVQTKADTLRMTRSPANAGFTVRDAQTHALLGRVDILDPLTTEYPVGRGRLLELVLGAGRDTSWTLEGIEPYVSASAEECLALCTLLAAPTNYVVEVNPGATFPFDTWGKAATNIQNAIDAAPDGGLILVSNGTYRLTSEILLTDGRTLRSVNGTAHTILDGQGAVRCVNMRNSTLEGFTVSNGYTTGKGGGIILPYVSGGCGGTIRDCRIVDCVAEGTAADDGGGGVWSSPGTSANPDPNAQTTALERVIIRNCRSAWSGGGFVGYYGSNILRNCTIENCETLSNGGGARFVRTGVVLDSTIASCLATNNGNGGGVAGALFMSGTTISNCTARRVSTTSEYGSGGGFYGNGTITNCTIVDNTAINPRRGGGGLMLTGGTVHDTLVRGNQVVQDNDPGSTSGGGGISKNNFNPVNLYSVRVIGNRSSVEGGGCYFLYRNVLFDRCEVTDNATSGGGRGGGISIGDGHPSAPCFRLRNTRVAHNHADGDGGGIYAYTSTADYTNVFESSTIVSNYANGHDGGGLFLHQADLILNSIVYGNDDPNGGGDRNIDINGGPIAVDHSCIESLTGAWNDGGNNLPLGTDPAFVNPVAQDYRLDRFSPCRNKGLLQGWMSGAVDLDDNGRVAEGAVDMGAYEYHRVGTLFRLR